MKIVIAGLYVLAAVLPFWGLAGIFRGARKAAEDRRRLIAEREQPEPTMGDLDVMIRAAWSLPEETVRSARTDLWLIGSGLTAGCVASIWSLFL